VRPGHTTTDGWVCVNRFAIHSPRNGRTPWIEFDLDYDLGDDKHLWAEVQCPSAAEEEVLNPIAPLLAMVAAITRFGADIKVTANADARDPAHGVWRLSVRYAVQPWWRKPQTRTLRTGTLSEHHHVNAEVPRLEEGGQNLG
jgi:hypothetical protein